MVWCWCLAVACWLLALGSQDAQVTKRRTFRKYSYRGVDLDQLLEMSNEQLLELVHARARRRFTRGLGRKPMGFMKRIRKAKKEVGAAECVPCCVCACVPRC